MAILKFRIHADYERVIRLREEIAKLEAQMKSFGRNTPINEIKTVEKRLAEAKAEMTGIVSEAAKAGAIMEKDFKTKIYDASNAVNSLTERIIEQRSIVRGAENEVKRLGEAYRKALKEDAGNAPSIKINYDSAKEALNNEKNALFNLTQEKAKATLETKKLRDEYAAFKQEAGEATKSAEGFTMSLGKIAGLVGGVAVLKQLGSQIVRVRGEFQEMETAIETLVGKDMADRLLPQIKEMAKVSPLTLTDIVGAEKMMLGFNIEADKTIGYLKALSDVSMGSSQKFNSLTLAFSQMSAAGRLMGQDLNQMINAGFNPLQVISEKTGKSIAQLKDEMSKGAVSAEMVQQAFIDATSAGGKFYNMSENASKTINGQISMMQDAIDAAFNEMGTKTEGIILKGIRATTSLIQNYEKIGKVLAGLVTTYGVYRTAILLTTAATSKHTIAEIALTNVRIAARKAQMALNASMMSNPYVALATVVAGLAASMWALKDNTAAAERAQERYNKSKEDATRKEQEHISSIEGLISKANDEAAATHKRQEALQDLKTQYRDIFGDYDLEALKLANTRDLLREVNAEYDRKMQKAREDEYNELNRFISSNAGKNLGKSAEKLYSEKVEYRNQMRADITKERVAEYVSILENQTDEYLGKVLDMANKALAGNAAFQLKGLTVTNDKMVDYTDIHKLNIEGENLKNIISAINTEVEKRAKTSTFAVDYEAAKKEWETAKKELEAIERDKDKFATKQYEAAKSRYETAEKEFKKLGGDTKGKTAKETDKAEKDAVREYNEQLAQQERVYQAQRRAEKDKARTAKDQEFMVSQARIDAMKEGAEKTRAQRELDNQRELEDLERQKQDYIDRVVENERAIFEAQEEQRAKNNEKYKKQSFDSETSRAKVDTTAYDDAIALALDKQKGQQDEVLAYLLEQYKSYEDAKQEILISYLNESDELQAMYEETGDERYKRSLDERHKAYVQAMNKLEREFGSKNFSLIFDDPSEMTMPMIEEALSMARAKMAQLDKDADPQTYQILANTIDKLEKARDNKPFEGWKTSLLDVMKILNRIKNLRKDIAAYEKLGDTESEEKSNKELKAAKKELGKALVGTGVATFGDTLSKAAASMREVAEASGDIDLMAQAEALEKAGGLFSSVASGFASGGAIGAIIGGASSLVDIFISSVTESKVVAAEAKKAYEDYIDELARSARQINEKDYDTIFGVRALEKVMDASEAAQRAWNDYYAAMNGETGNKQSGRGYAKGLENMTLPSGERLKDKFREIFEWEENGRGQYEVSGLNLEEARLLLEAYKGTNQENAIWYQNLKMAVEALEDYEKNIEIVDEYLGQLFSNVGSEIADAIMQGNDALEVLEKNAGQIFKSIAKEMIVSALIGPEFIEKYKKMLRDAMATEGAEDDAAVLAQLAEELGGNIEAASAQWEELQRIAKEKGIDLFGAEDTSQQASTRGYQTLSEDTGNELAGRALAQYESNLRMEEAMSSAKESIDLMTQNQITIRDIAAESRGLIADSYLELQQIRENTGAIVKPIKEMNDKIQSWDSKIKSL